MPGFELDVTKPVGDIAITTPEGRIVYDVSDITKEPLLLFQQMGKDEDADHALEMIAALGSILSPQNGGPPAAELFTRLYEDGFLGVTYLRQIAEYVQSTAVGVPPA
jgi:hypothetical protein